MEINNHPSILIYDGNCSFCRTTIDWVKQNALPGQFEFLPCQSDDRKKRFPFLTDESCMEWIQLILENQTVLSGSNALPEILKRLKRWRFVSRLFRIPGIKWVAPYIYAWVAKHRYQLTCIIQHK